ncbi:MAG: hypothetical protein ACOY45_02750 [Pseudomonadota bacterium]
MAKYDVQHICGHTVSHQLFGKEIERTRKIEWLKTTDCPDCHRAARDAERNAATAAAKAAAQDSGLPALIGTDKQIAWAERLRAEMLATVSEQVAAIITRAPDAATADLVKVAEAKIRRQDRAAYWIERHNNRDIVDRLRKLVMDAIAARDATA